MRTSIYDHSSNIVDDFIFMGELFIVLVVIVFIINWLNSDDDDPTSFDDETSMIY